MHTLEEFLQKKKKIGVVGLGYVGLPLLIAFEKYFTMVGFDISKRKIQCLRSGVDDTCEVGDDAIRNSRAVFSDDPSVLRDCHFVIVAVPTPVDDYKTPDLSPVTGATEIVSRNLCPGAVIVYESTVYPGVTEDICRPILEKAGHIYHKDFHLGYSPERINPGDHTHRFEDILKIVSGDSAQSLELISGIYKTVVRAGVHKAGSIKVAEAAKVIENVQRDVNIALVNELAMVFHIMGIDTLEVLQAAGTKWNFIHMRPGLVGGHCIGVDPYYLTYKAEQLGYHPQIITSGRRINDGMARYVAEQTVKKMIQSGKTVRGSKILVLGLTFKEDCPDTRNSKVYDLIHELKEYCCEVKALDPWVDESLSKEEFAVLRPASDERFDAIVLAVPHKKFGDIREYFPLLLENGVLIDVKSRFTRSEIPSEIAHWRL